MEHSYTRDFRLLESSQTAMTRTLMIHRPPQCPSCHTHSHDERIDLEESYNPPIPSYNEESARRAMQESENIVVTARNSEHDEDDWEERVAKFGWSVQQFKLFDRVARLLDMDRLARLTNTEKQHEPVHRRTVIDKSVSRLRQALASVSWETRLTQWLHGLLMENLPPCYLAIYIDILQTLHAKLPLLVNKMIFGSTLNVGQEFLGPVLKKPWEPIVSHKNRKLPGQPYIVVVPSVPNFMQPTGRQQKWFSLFATMSSVIPIQGSASKTNIDKQSLHALAEHMVASTRAKIQQIRSSAPNRSIILVGFDAGSALAIQVGLVESVSCVICLGFSYNTYNGVRGAPDDHIVDISCPVLFVIGQNSARASHEEIEMLRDRMSTQTSLVVVGAADECLRVSKTKRKIEGVTQSMVDNMVADEIAEFATNCLICPPRTKQSTTVGQFVNGLMTSEYTDPSSLSTQRNENDSTTSRKRKHAQDPKSDTKVQRKPYTRRTPKTLEQSRTIQSSQEALDIAVQSILPTTSEKQIKTEKIILPPPKDEDGTKYEGRESGGTHIISGVGSTPIMLPALKRAPLQPAVNITGVMQHPSDVNVKLINTNQLIQLKPATGTTQKFYSIKSTTKPVVSVLANSTTSANETGIQTAEISSPPKFTIVRNMGTTPTVFTNVPQQEDVAMKVERDLSETNIFDLPIVFADNDGIIQDGSPEKIKQESRPSSAMGTATTTVTLANSTKTAAPAADLQNTTIVPSMGNRFVTLQQPTGSLPITIGKQKQIVNLIINKGNLKPVDPSMLVPMGTKINIPASTASSSVHCSTVPTTGTIVSTGTRGPTNIGKLVLTKPAGAGASGVVKNLSELLTSGKVEFVSNASVKQPAISGTPVSIQQGKFQPIIINSIGTNKLQSMTTKDSTTSAGSVSSSVSGNIQNIGGNKIFIKTNSSGLASASNATVSSLVGRNVMLKQFNIVTTSTGVKQTVPTIVSTSTEASSKEK